MVFIWTRCNYSSNILNAPDEFVSAGKHDKFLSRFFQKSTRIWVRFCKLFISTVSDYQKPTRAAKESLNHFKNDIFTLNKLCWQSVVCLLAALFQLELKKLHPELPTVYTGPEKYCFEEIKTSSNHFRETIRETIHVLSQMVPMTQLPKALSFISKHCEAFSRK